MSIIKRERPYLLTKSKFMAGRQCLKRVYLEVNHPERATPVDEARREIFDLGHLIGRLAHEHFPGGVLVDVDRSHPQEALRQTAALLRDPIVPAIFEGAFLFDDILVRADIVERQPDGTWHLVECKSSMSVKPEHHWDVAVQTYVLRGVGLQVTRCSLMRVSRKYKHRGGPRVDSKTFLVFDDVTSYATALDRHVKREVALMKRAVLEAEPPHIEPDAHCHEPHHCAFWAHCTETKPARWVGYLPDGGSQIPKLIARGVHTIDDIPWEFNLSPIQRAAQAEREWCASSFTAALQRIQYPVHHLHIEAGLFGIPLHRGMRPYEHLPFQWTTLTESETGEVHLQEWLSLERCDPRGVLVEALLHTLGCGGSIVVYSDFIRVVLTKLADALSDHKMTLRALRGRIVDLCRLIRTHYYHPKLSPAVYDHEAFARASSIQDLLSGLPSPERYQSLATLDRRWSARQYHKALQPSARRGDHDAFRRDVCIRSRQAVQALYDTRLYLVARASSWDEARAREDAA